MKPLNKVLSFFCLILFSLQLQGTSWKKDGRVDTVLRGITTEKYPGKTPAKVPECRLLHDDAEGEIIYDRKASGSLDDWKTEGVADLNISDEGALSVRTNNGTASNGKKSRQSNVWLKDIELPDKYQVEWSYKCEKTGNIMIIFNAQPFGLTGLFEDPRADASYDDLTSYKKIVCYTIGFNRPGGPSVLRKLGGDVPEGWNGAVFNTPDWLDRDSVTTLSRRKEPAIPAAEGANTVNYKLGYENGRIRFWINDILVHDMTDRGQYPYHTTALKGGRVAFRNFSGISHDYYTSIVIRALK